MGERKSKEGKRENENEYILCECCSAQQLLKSVSQSEFNKGTTKRYVMGFGLKYV